jgi:hypothetical protein
LSIESFSMGRCRKLMRKTGNQELSDSSVPSFLIRRAPDFLQITLCPHLINENHQPRRQYGKPITQS